MARIDRYRSEDRRSVETLYRRVFGHDAADASRLRWEWQYERNPTSPDGPLIWVAREGPAIVGQLATMPVRLMLRGREVNGTWGTDAMVTPERQRQGVGEFLFRTWEAHGVATLGLGLSTSSSSLLRKLRWPILEVPCVVKPLTRRALRVARWSTPVNRLVSALTLPLVRIVGRTRPLGAETRLIRRFDEDFDRLWARVGPKLDLAVRRDARYLNWKYVAPPHVRYSIASLRRHDEPAGYVVYRHAHEPLGRVTLIVDFLVDPDDEPGLRTLLAWVDREAHAVDSDKVRCYTPHAAFRRTLRRSGYFAVKSTLEMVARIEGIDSVSTSTQTDRWHVTLGDADVDR